MTEPDEIDVAFLEGLEPAAPSAEADHAVLAIAEACLRRGPGGSRRPAAPWGWTALALGVAAILLLSAVVVLHRGGMRPEAGKADLVTAGRQALSEMRTEIEEINEMTDLIPPDRSDERQVIAERIKVCLLDLQELEARIGGDDGDVPSDASERKEVKL